VYWFDSQNYANLLKLKKAIYEITGCDGVEFDFSVSFWQT